ncbi:uncharacterized protein LOC126770681 isoform X2 [Nymphalis io]|uniref:uncharacterized protein LOC126770681 isoform X2 n=1 Tax=Inachis io TaxID=171585 RepID=UPI00216885D0|nr:uncharacterized protein LOC126770681 isoform X2 [Nymphalis io]
MKIFVAYLVTLTIFAEAYEPSIKIYEIRRARHETADDHYYPNDVKMTSQSRDGNDDVIGKLRNGIINKFQRISDFSDEDYDYTQQEEFDDKTRSVPVFIVSNDKSSNQK